MKFSYAMKERYSRIFNMSKWLKMQWERVRGKGTKMVDLGGYVIILVETNDKRVKLYGESLHTERRESVSSLSGSPADKADLEVADEILEINGKALQNCSHTEVIAHIHNVSRDLKFYSKSPPKNTKEKQSERRLSLSN